LGNNLDEWGEPSCFLCIWRASTEEPHNKEALRRKKKHEASTKHNNTMKNEKIDGKNK
jgi:hypothetical protein